MGSINHNQLTLSIWLLYVLVFIVSQVDAQNAPQQLNVTFITDAITKGAGKSSTTFQEFIYYYSYFSRYDLMINNLIG